MRLNLRASAISLIAFLFIVFLSSCAEKSPEKPKQEEKSDSRLIEFKGRQIDLKPYFEAFPFSRFTAFYKAGKLIYVMQDSVSTLMETSLKPNAGLESGKAISDIDMSKRNVWGIRYNKNDKCYYWNGDERNDEALNLYKLNPETKKIDKITDVPYIFAWRWNEEASKIAYVARLGVTDKRLGELRILDLETNKEEALIQDNSALRFSWGAPTWRPGNQGIVLTALKDAHRNFSNLVYIDLETKTMKCLTDSTVERKSSYAMKDWLSDNEFAYLSNESGYTNIYAYNLKKNKTRQISSLDKDIKDCDFVELNGKKYIFAIVATPIENEIYLIDPYKAKIVNQMKIDLNISILDTDGDKALVSGYSAMEMFKMSEIKISEETFEFSDFLGLPDSLRDKVVNADVKKIEYPTFDIDPKTGKQRMLHAFVYEPKNPLPKGEQIVLIQSFYGGGNYYSKRNQIMAEAGIILLSPSPRGSSGFGREFSSMNDKDLGGNEIIDIIYAGKYMTEKYGIPPSRIGVFGGSHGGYAVMRLLTFPGEVNGNKAEFKWGFGISHAGFSDIIHFYNNCNIPDWVILEAGDPKTEKAKLHSRSPLFNADKAMGKLLLTHGSNDQRVPVEGSRWMADSLKKYNKDYTYVEFDGQGHILKGLENNIKYFRTWFDFLKTIK